MDVPIGRPANHVFREKYNGLIVDSLGGVRDLLRALSIEGAAEGGDGQPGHGPIQSKDELVATLKEALTEALAFWEERGVVLTPTLNRPDSPSGEHGHPVGRHDGRRRGR